MKRKSLLFALLLAFIAPWAANAQNRATVTIGTGTSNMYYPLPGFYGWNYNVFLYTPTAAPELGIDSDISSIAFDVSTNNTNTGSEMYIWVKDVDADYALATTTTFANYITDATQVYSNDDFSSTLGWNTFNFSSTFSHQGGKALLVAVRGVGCSTGGGCSRQCHYTTATNTYWYKNQDNSDPGQTVSGSLSSNRANIQLSLTYTAPVCMAPTGLAATLTPGNGTVATLNWTPGAEETVWVLEYGTASDFTGATSVNVSGTPEKALSGLTAEQTYYARVKPDCDTDGTKWSNTCEFTPTNVYSVTVNEGTSTSGYAPLYGNYNSSYDQMIYTASQLEDAGITGPCTITKIGFNSSAANSNARKPIIYIYQTDKSSFSSTTDFISINEFTKVYDFNDHSQWNITAGWNEFELDTPFDYDGSSNLVVAVHCGMASYKSTSFYYSTTTSNQVIYAYSDSTDPIPATYEGNWANYPTTGASATSYKAVSTYLPSLKLYYEPIAVTCAKPTGLVESNTTAHGVTITWNSETGETFDYAIVKGTGIDPETVTYAGSETATGTTCSHTWSSGLDGDSDYTVFIRKNCGNGDYSNPATKVIHTEIACPAPTVLTWVESTTTTAKFSWTDNAGASEWQICINDDETNLIPANSNTNFIVSTGLSAATTYTAKVRAVCGGVDGESAWSNAVTFTTACDAYTVTDEEIYTFGFEEDGPFACWSVISGNITCYSGTPNTGSKRLDFRGTTSNMIALPQFTNATSTLALEFYTRPESTGGSSGKFAIGYMTDITDASTFVAVETYNSTEMTTNYVMKTVYFPGAPANTYIAMRQFDCATNYYWYVDDVTVSLAPTCWQPQNLAYSNVTNEAATFTWERHAMGTETSWVLQYGTDDTFATYIDQVTVNNDPTYTIQSGLSATTTYYVRVKPACDTEGNLWTEMSFDTEADCAAPTHLAVTENSETVEGATITWNGRNDSFIVEHGIYDYSATPTTIPVTIVEEDFENSNGMLPTGWNQIGSGSATNQTSYAHSTSHCIKFSGATANNVLVLPAFDMEINTMTISYWSRPESASMSYSGYFDVGYVTDATNASTFVAVHTNQADEGTDYQHIENISFENAPNGARIAFRHRAGSSSWYWFIDDITITGIEYQYPIVWTPDGPAANENNSGEYIFEGLDDNTTYFARVKGVCGNVESDYSDVVSFTTLDACPAPTNLTVGTVTYNTATISWTGGLATEWKVWIKESTETDYPTTYSTVTTATKSFANLTANTTYDVKIAPTCDETRYLEALEAFTTPCTPITNFPWSEGFEDGELSFCWDQDGDGTWTVGTGDGNTSPSIGAHTGTYNAKITHVTSGDVTKLITPVLDLTSLNHPMLTFWYINRKWSNDIDGFAVYYRTASDAEWTLIEATEEAHETWTEATYVLPNPSATYQIAFEMTDNYGYGVGIDDVTIAEAPTFTKTIAPYTSDGGYYLIASPLADAVDPTTVGMITDDWGADAPTPADCTYDFFAFDQDQELEWVNYRGNAFNMVNGKGYLYASKEGTTITFVGMPYSGEGIVTLDRTDDDEADFQGWNLVGNPFAEEAYVDLDRPFYVMDANGAEIIAETNVTRAIQPMEGIFVTAEQDGETMTFTTEAPGAKANLVLNITQGRSNTIDRAIISVGQGRTLPKFMLNPGNTKLYIPQNGEDYAVVCSRISDEIPVSFEPAENGLYTISVDVRNMNLRSLLLKDKVRNVTVDLLRTPSYQFKARTEDRADRFMLSFRISNSVYKETVVKGANSEDFGFFSYGNWVIDNEGEATLQVIDLNGRVLSSENIYGSTSIQVDAAPGVYMLRLVNGNDVKTQKVVVR